MLNHNDIPATSLSIAILTGTKRATIERYIRRYHSYLIKKLNTGSDGCFFRYTLSTQGIRCLAAFMVRHERGYDLKLKSDRPQHVDYTGFKVVPDDYEKRLAYITRKNEGVKSD
jgi:hypothetical protein